MIKVYVNFGSLKAFQKGSWVNAKIQFADQYDVEVVLDLDKIEVATQQNGITVRKKRWWKIK